MSNALYKILDTDASSYAYDTMTNRIIRIKGCFPRGVSEDQKHAMILEYLTRQNLLSKNNLKEVVWQTPFAEYKQYIDHNISDLVLETEQNCNLRCDYCVYSGNYAGTRTHRTVAMTETIAQKAIEMFFRHNRESPKAKISFYGGEPLLRFAFVKDCIAYAKQLFAGKPLSFDLSANGTLMTQEVMDWAQSEPSLTITVTLNGYEHDRYRHFANGEGSLGIILGRLAYAKKQFPHLLRERIRFLCNTASFQELLSARQFYLDHDLPLPMPTSIIDRGGNETIQALFRQDAQAEKAAYNALKALYTTTSDAFCHAYFSPQWIPIHRRNMAPFTDKAFIERTCMPFRVKLFVTAPGELHMCERVTPMYDLGHVNTGFDYDNILKMLNEYQAVSAKACIHCWAQRLCSRCFAGMVFAGKWDNIPDDLCEKMRLSVLHDLKLYCEICEKNPELLQHSV